MFSLKKMNDANTFGQKQKYNLRTFAKKNAVQNANIIDKLADKSPPNKKEDKSDLEK